jgi:hypothetical protein
MRNLLIREIYNLERKTNISVMEDLRKWSNHELLEYYGNLRIEEYYQRMEHEDESKRTI